MKITRVKVSRVPMKNGLVGFASLVIDDWLLLGNIAIFLRLGSKDKIRLVFPQKRVNNEAINIFYPLIQDRYYELEQAVQKRFNELS